MGPIKEQLTVDEVAGMLKADRRVVYDLIKSGKIKAGKVGRGWRIEAESVAIFLNNVQDAQKEEKVMGPEEFVEELLREEAAQAMTKDMEMQRKSEVAERIRPEVVSILKQYAKAVAKIGISVGEPEVNGDTTKYYFSYEARVNELIVTIDTKGVWLDFDKIKPDDDKGMAALLGWKSQSEFIKRKAQEMRKCESLPFDSWDKDGFMNAMNNALSFIRTY